eukprot:CAMPEP_0177686606 /NCGR_PEP_ID=MMETSP0447-20121125/33661_1 /TAXON_ID=0 /ORGANISM="Stygamoeba regulata, Strain BSH-02190019" /LENGTH=334 /DNA_ID=CAMNT_0019196745 /DNA_START=160 /DNA_END=1164 /DNA_ORIENTATION=-
MGNTESASAPEDSPPLEDRHSEIYEGERDEQGRYHGQGRLFYVSDDPRCRDCYIGAFVHGLREGIGELRWADHSAVYNGEFADDKINGYGTLQWSTGMKYTGEWVDNKFEGRGTLVWKNGKKYEGSWRQSKPHGCGILTYTRDDQRNRCYYKGDWRDGKRYGHGVMEWTNHARYEGNWRKGKRYGYGVHSFPNGERYMGNWRNGRREGKGVRHYKNGDKFIGAWANDRKTGIGEYIEQHGRTRLERWVNGKLSSDQHEVPQVIQTLQVLCIEAVARDEELYYLTRMNMCLPMSLQQLVEGYYRNVVQRERMQASPIFEWARETISEIKFTIGSA